MSDYLHDKLINRIGNKNSRPIDEVEQMFAEAKLEWYRMYGHTLSDDEFLRKIDELLRLPVPLAVTPAKVASMPRSWLYFEMMEG